MFSSVFTAYLFAFLQFNQSLPVFEKKCFFVCNVFTNTCFIRKALPGTKQISYYKGDLLTNFRPCEKPKQASKAVSSPWKGHKYP